MAPAIIQLDSDRAAWLATPALAKVFTALRAGGHEARIVGGAVRNVLSGRDVTDIDLATTAPPDDVLRLARDAGLGAYPTGIDHGTVTVTADGRAFEVTSLRRDVETDGRRAVVAFTRDWYEDSLRRDFTINALYLDQLHHVYDFHGGLADLENGRVRFIGDAHNRIREDYLRILRFFRFTAEYAPGLPDPEGLAACADLKSGIAQLSAERIGAEVLKILATPRPSALCQVMEETGISKQIFGTPTTPALLAKLEAIETAQSLKRDPLLRLGVLALDAGGNCRALADRLRLSNESARALQSAVHIDPAITAAGAPLREVRAALYRLGNPAFDRTVIASWARSDDKPDNPARVAFLTLSANWIALKCPVSGADILALGVPAGPRVGQILKAFENWWIAEDFPLAQALNREKLAALVSASTQNS